MSVRRLLVPALALALPAAARAQAPAGPPVPPPQVVTTGRAEAGVAPDRAAVTVAVETRALTAAQAAADNARVQARVLAALRALGLPNERVGSAGYSVTPEYTYAENRPARVSGYTARNGVRAELTDVQTVGRVIDAALAAGANNVSGVEFSSTKLNDARRGALAEAVRAACLDASAMARAVGGTITQPIELSSSFEEPRPPMPMAMARGVAASAPETQVSPGTLTTNVIVNARWSVAFGPDRGPGATCQ